VSGGDIRLYGHGRGVTKGTPGCITMQYVYTVQHQGQNTSSYQSNGGAGRMTGAGNFPPSTLYGKNALERAPGIDLELPFKNRPDFQAQCHVERFTEAVANTAAASVAGWPAAAPTLHRIDP